MFSIIRNLLIFFILLFFVYLIVSLIVKRKIIQKREIELQIEAQTNLEEEAKLQEGFTFNTQNGELSSIKVSSGSLVIKNVSKNTNLPLREFCIKASYNSALTGNYINTDMIKYVLSRGCRFLDFEVYSIKDKPYVAYSTSSTFDSQTENTVLLSDVLKTIAQSGFMAPSPNPQDPLFIQFRIKTTDNDLYIQIAMSLHENLKTRLYKGKVNGSTPLSELLGKIIIVIDRSTSPNYSCNLSSSTTNQKYNLKNYVNMESGGNNLRIFKYSQIMNQQTTPIYVNDDGITTTSNCNTGNTMKLVVPDIGYNIIGISRNPSPIQLITDYGVQIIAYRFYQVDSNLQSYEQLFSDGQSAFTPMAQVLNSINNPKD